MALYGPRASWVQNARAAGGHAVLVAGRGRPVRLVELPVAERAPVLLAWVSRRAFTHSPRSSARTFFGLDHLPRLDELARVADRYPVFRIEDDASAAVPQKTRHQ